MKYTIPLNNEEHRTRKVLEIFSFLNPFSKLSNREKDVFSIFIDEYLELNKKLNDEQIFTILFGYDFKVTISEKLSTKNKNISMDFVTNYITKLRKKGFIVGRKIPDKFIKLFEIERLDNEIIFHFEIKN